MEFKDIQIMAREWEPICERTADTYLAVANSCTDGAQTHEGDARLFALASIEAIRWRAYQHFCAALI